MTDENELVLHDGRQLPATPDLRRALRDGVDSVLADELAKAGEIKTPEDAAALVRRFGAMNETLTDYGRAFTDTARTVKDVLREHALLTVNGDSDGVPNGSLAIVDTDGSTITVRPDLINEHRFDLDALVSAVAAAHIETPDAKARLFELFQAEFSGQGDRSRELLAGLLADVMKTLVGLGKFEPQVTKVKKLQAELAQAELDQVSATVTDAHTKIIKERGTSVVRTFPKGEK